MYKSIIKPIFFLFSAEKAHYLAMDLLGFALKVPGLPWLFKSLYQEKDRRLEREVFGLKFPNPVGLAAGFDKDARWIDNLENLGFGFIEIGTLTPVPQEGNSQPRLFRLPADHGLINRMGFNNLGTASAVERLKRRKSNVIVGGNIGKNKITPNTEAVNDYVKSFDLLFDHVDYFVVNVSSPNTPGLRALQEKEPLMHLLSTLNDLNQKRPNPKPVLLKIAPDLTWTQIDEVIEILMELSLAGIIASNTTISRAYLNTSKDEIENIGNGGLSGAPVRKRSTEIISYINEKTKGALPIIAVGGIFTAADAQEKLDAGASLVQVYTGFIYEGPGIVKRILQGLKKGTK